jgi:hypothetical protein
MCNVKELWLPVVGYEGFYEVSNLGNVRALGRFASNKKIYGQLLVIRTNEKRNGYQEVKLKVAGRKLVNKKVHRLVAESFLLNPNDLPQVNHIDFDVKNNRVENLEWCTAKENINHSRHRRPNMRGKFGRKIDAFDKSGNLVGSYGSIREAARALNCFGQNICAVLNGKFKWVKGYTFKDSV